jgi:hypothetical protein
MFSLLISHTFYLNRVLRKAAVRFMLLQGTVLTWLLLILPMPSCSSLQTKRSNGRCITSERDALLSLKASLSDPGANSYHGKEKIAANGRVFTAAIEPTMLSSWISIMIILAAALVILSTHSEVR